MSRLILPPLPISSGAAVMAIGIFVLAALQRMPWGVLPATDLLSVVVLALWLLLAVTFLATSLAGRGAITQSGDPLRSFGIGTWVAGTAVADQVLHLVAPGWRALALALALIALLLWLWFLALVVRGLRAILADRARTGVTGSILLGTVATEAIVLLAYDLFAHRLPLLVIGVLIALDYLLYAVCAGLIALRYTAGSRWTLVDDWDNTNCILHGAMSISGLAVVTTGALPMQMAVLTWIWVATMFLLVEAIEAARLVARQRAYGWRRGIGTYHVSQWARNFTFGMFYAFTLALSSHAAATGDIARVWGAIVQYGPYPVLALLLVEIALFAISRIRPDGPQAARARHHAYDGSGRFTSHLTPGSTHFSMPACGSSVRTTSPRKP